MSVQPAPLAYVLQGWGDTQTSLVRAVAPLTREQLGWKPGPRLRSAGDIAAHISRGRLGWFERMSAPGSRELAEQAAGWAPDEEAGGDAAELVRRLEATWKMIEQTLEAWTVADLAQTYQQPYQGRTYAVSRQWTLWRILAHDLHHGGELALTLGLQGIRVFELGDLGGHIRLPPLA